MAGPARAHLEDEVTGRVAGPQRGQRNADLVVEGTVRGNGLTGAGQYRGQEVLRAGLPARAGEGDDAEVGQVLQHGTSQPP